MKYILQGIKDYCKDCWHDWHLHCVEKSQKDEALFFWAEEVDCWVAIVDWKEGSVWHYIRQRKIAERKDVK